MTMPFRPAKDLAMLLLASEFPNLESRIGVTISQPRREKAEVSNMGSEKTGRTIQFVTQGVSPYWHVVEVIISPLSSSLDILATTSDRSPAHEP